MHNVASNKNKFVPNEQVHWLVLLLNIWGHSQFYSSYKAHIEIHVDLLT
jgi:hypothetical protein